MNQLQGSVWKENFSEKKSAEFTYSALFFCLFHKRTHLFDLYDWKICETKNFLLSVRGARDKILNVHVLKRIFFGSAKLYQKKNR